MDLRIQKIFEDEMRGDTSFQEKASGLSLLFGVNKYTQREMKNTWDLGIKHGIEIGLNVASMKGQIVELNNNTISNKNKEFLDKFYKLAEEYKCAIQYHPTIGMVVLDREYSACV